MSTHAHKGNMQKLDSFTYGDCKAAINLVDILKKLDNPKVCNYISGIMHWAFSLFNTCEKIENIQHRKSISQLVYNKTIEIVKNSISGIPENVKSHAMNIITARYRAILNGKN